MIGSVLVVAMEATVSSILGDRNRKESTAISCIASISLEMLSGATLFQAALFWIAARIWLDIAYNYLCHHPWWWMDAPEGEKSEASEFLKNFGKWEILTIRALITIGCLMIAFK